MENENPNNQVQVNFQKLAWKDALYQDDSDFQELIEQGWSNGYHERLNHYLLVTYAFSNCRLDPELGITIRGQLHPATRERRRRLLHRRVPDPRIRNHRRPNEKPQD